MRSYSNPFRSLTSEIVSRRGVDAFIESFCSDTLGVIPREPWDTLLLIYSAPGAGKTALLRSVSSDTVHLIARQPDLHPQLNRQLVRIGVLRSKGDQALLGFRVPLSRDFRTIVDLEPDPTVAQRIFCSLLDARIVLSLYRAVAQVGRENANGVVDGQIVATVEAATDLERLGGGNIEAAREWATNTERRMLNRLDSVLPPSDDFTAHAALYSLRALNGASVIVGQGEGAAKYRPFILFDDGHCLSPHQRRALLESLQDRELDLPRWYAERYSAMDAEAIIRTGEPNRDSRTIYLEQSIQRIKKKSGVAEGERGEGLYRLLNDIANRRAGKALRAYGGSQEHLGFFDLLNHGLGDVSEKCQTASTAIEQRILQGWKVDEVAALRNVLAEPTNVYEMAVRWRTIEILLERGPSSRPTPGAFGRLKEVAQLFLRNEFHIPYYFGSSRLCKLSSDNVGQFLNLSGSLFDLMLAQISLRQPTGLNPGQQELCILASSRDYWLGIPGRVTMGIAVQSLLRSVAEHCRSNTYQPTAPYAPGVTGIAISMRERAALLDHRYRESTPGADALYECLSRAIAYNLFSVRLDVDSKNMKWFVLYLNRMICAQFGLPLGLGGYNPVQLDLMCKWVAS